MSVVTQFVGGRKVASIVNQHSGGGTSQPRVDLATKGSASYASSSVAAGALQTMLNISGRGALNFVAAYAVNGTPRTVRIKVTLDGVVVFDATSASVSGIGAGIVAVGVVGDPTINVAPVFQPVRFYSSAKVEIASSVASDSTFITTAINYEVDQ